MRVYSHFSSMSIFGYDAIGKCVIWKLNLTGLVNINFHRRMTLEISMRVACSRQGRFERRILFGQAEQSCVLPVACGRSMCSRMSCQVVEGICVRMDQEPSRHLEV
ncbi:hypothetical protein BDE02_02G031000 [Populus trichocarpa]|nr:hypothetical protein BDE02_02G031000 [Populus trichocarpa]